MCKCWCERCTSCSRCSTRQALHVDHAINGNQKTEERYSFVLVPHDSLIHTPALQLLAAIEIIMITTTFNSLETFTVVSHLQQHFKESRVIFQQEFNLLLSTQKYAVPVGAFYNWLMCVMLVHYNVIIKELYYHCTGFCLCYPRYMDGLWKHGNDLK